MSNTFSIIANTISASRIIYTYHIDGILVAMQDLYNYGEDKEIKTFADGKPEHQYC